MYKRKDLTMDQPSKQERRRIRRRSLAYYMLVMDAQTMGKIGHLVDITPEGLLIDSEKPLPVGKDIHLLLDTPPDVSNKANISFKARSKWCRPDAIDPSLYDIGFSIVEISTADAAILKLLSEKYSQQEGYSFPWRT
jgi:hypothetical protein